MVKKIIISLVFSSFLLFYPSSSLATQQLSQRWVCLNAVWCKDDAAGCATKDAHRAKLSVKPDVKPFSNAQTFIVECLATPQGQICTTGNATADQQVYGANNVARLAIIDYTFSGIFQANTNTPVSNPSVSTSSGLVGPFEWESATPNEIPRKFLALNLFDPGSSQTGNDGGQQQVTFDFGSSSKNCVSINWDPYGRVFDSQSLEPIPGASVTLFDSNNRMVGSENFIGSIVNPQTTVEDGAFSFVVPDGTYKLSALKSGYILAANSAKLNPAYSRAYSDIYRGENIVQQGAVIHRDIALDSLSGPKTYPLLFNYFYESDKLGRVIVEGTVSHPLTTVKAYSVKLDTALQTQEPKRSRYKLIKTVSADKNGRFKIDINQSGFEMGEIFGELEFQKLDFTGGALGLGSFHLIPRVEAAETTTLRFDPIPTYLEGYAYNANGQIIPNAIVGIYLTYSEKPYYETKADAKGYFKISSEFLPGEAYKIRYTSTAGVRSDVSTSKFIAQNASYIASSGVNLNTYKDSTGKTQNANNSQKPGISPTEQNSSGNKTNTINKPVSSNATILLVMLVALVLLGASVVLIGVYLYNKNKNNVDNNPSHPRSPVS